MLVLAKLARQIIDVESVLANVWPYEKVLGVIAVITTLPLIALYAESPMPTYTSSPTENP